MSDATKNWLILLVGVLAVVMVLKVQGNRVNLITRR